MAKQWRFEQDEKAEWRWTHLDGEKDPIRSATGFPNQLRCMMDAMRFVVQRRRAQQPSANEADSTSQAH